MSEQRQQTSPDVYYSMRNVTEHQVDDNVIIHLNLNSTYLKVFPAHESLSYTFICINRLVVIYPQLLIKSNSHEKRRRRHKMNFYCLI